MAEPLKVSHKPQLKDASCRSDRGSSNCAANTDRRELWEICSVPRSLLYCHMVVTYSIDFPPAIVHNVHIANLVFISISATLGGGAGLVIIRIFIREESLL